MTLNTLETSRLTLVAATSELVAADLEGRDSLAKALRAEVPLNWPPDLYGRSAMEYAQRQLHDPAEQGWSFWYVLNKNGKKPMVCGICGFKGRPDSEGSVEIGYSVIGQSQNAGIATEAAGALTGWAFGHHNVMEVKAETLPHLRQSIRVLEKNGFHFRGPGSEHGVIRYAVGRPDQHSFTDRARADGF